MTQSAVLAVGLIPNISIIRRHIASSVFVEAVATHALSVSQLQIHQQERQAKLATHQMGQSRSQIV